MTSSSPSELDCCPHCDLLVSKPPERAWRLDCPRCAGLLGGSCTAGRDTSFACYLGAMICLALLYFFPVATIHALGTSQAATLGDDVVALARHGLLPVACVVLLTTIVLPAMQIIASIWVLWPRQRSVRSVAWRWCFRARQFLRPWSMLEIFMLGTIVALVKLQGLAGVVLDPGAWLLAAFVLLHAGAEHAFRAADLWEGASS